MYISSQKVSVNTVLCTAKMPVHGSKALSGESSWGFAVVDLPCEKHLVVIFIVSFFLT